MRNILVLSALCLALAGCTTADLTKAFAMITTGCAVATAAEAADPTFTQHNGRVVAGVAYICADEASAQALAGTVNTQVNAVVK